MYNPAEQYEIFNSYLRKNCNYNDCIRQVCVK